MTRTYNVYPGKRVELPRITAFMMEYNGLCERHGLYFTAALSYGYEPSDTDICVSIVPEGERPPEDDDLFIDPHLSVAIPEVAEAITRAKKEYVDEQKAKERINAERAKEIAATDPIPGLEMAHQYIGAGNTSAWVPVAKAAIAEAIARLGRNRDGR